MNWGMKMSVNFLHGYVRFTEGNQWNNISEMGFWIEGEDEDVYNKLRKIMKQQRVEAYLIELVSQPQKSGMLPLPQNKLEYITKESE